MKYLPSWTEDGLMDLKNTILTKSMFVFWNICLWEAELGTSNGFGM